MSSLRSRLVCALRLASTAFSLAAAGSSPFCKAVPGTPDWPSPQDWARLNESLAGALLQPPPPGAVCHPGQGTYNATECPLVRAAWSTYDFHQADPVSVDWNNWANDSCLPQEGAPCSPGGYPVFVVNASTARHVQLGVAFARKHNIRLVVKSTGHDFLGRSIAPSSLSIWVRHLRGLETHDSFRPRGCKTTINTTAVTVGGGMQMWDMYSALDALKQAVVGGGGKSVSVGGFLTGAGHGLLSATHGLAADHVLEMEVVTPAGHIVTANECQNEDLFWAMRGGGGSTFGIMTSVTVRTFPTPKLESLTVAIGTTSITNTRAIFDMVAYVLSQFPSLGDQGLSGYSYVFPNTTDPFNGANALMGGMTMACVLQDSSPDDMRRLWEPVLNHVNATWPGLFQFVYRPRSFPSFLAWYQANYDSSPAGYDLYVGSRLLDAEALTADPTKTAAAFERFVAGSFATAYLVSGKGVRNARPRGGGNAVLPAWRNAYVHATTSVVATPLDTADKAAKHKSLQERVAALRQLAPNSGAYMNEADPDEPNWQREFWGCNYQRLLRIKRAVDPDDVFWCPPCVGNERWQQVGDRLCRV